MSKKAEMAFYHHIFCSCVAIYKLEVNVRASNL